MNTQEFIEKAKKIHGDKYDYSKVEYVHSHTKVCIICPKHGEFWQAPRHHLNGSGCPKCAGTIQLTTEEFIRRAKEVHGDKYDYSKVEYVHSHTKVCIICPKHGEFWQIPVHHLNGSGCPKCAGTIQLTTEEFIRRAKEVHGDRYDYSKVKYVNARTKVCIICPKHGEFWQTASEHLRGQGCPKCAQEKKKDSSLTSTTEEFIRKAKEVHGDRYDYSKVEYVNAYTKVRIICPIHGDFEQNAHSHLNGRGCPKCNESQMEKNTAKFLEENNIDYISQARKKDLVWLERQSLDFYIPKYHIAIECQGGQHFKTVDFFGGKRGYSDRLKKDLSKYNKCLSNNVKLIYYVPESLVEEVINNTKYNNIYNSENVFSDLTEFNEKYLVI